MANGSDATLAERFPVVVSGALGLVLSQSVNVVQQFCGCLTGDQLATLNNWLGTLIAFGVIVWQYRNVWSKASVAKVAAEAGLSLKAAEQVVKSDSGNGGSHEPPTHD